MHRLEPLAMPLKGCNLIEASAGTGKTYTITTLYLRLLLGLSDPDSPDEGLSVEQILVVTFTEAATEEIRDRVRKRLEQARNAIFLRELEQGQNDPLLADLIAQLPDPELALKRLDAAVKTMDEACIFTIHGFCQRMLKYHAFESGSLFESEFVLDEREYLEYAVRDFWRRTLYPMSGLLLKLCLDYCSTPDDLLLELSSLLNKHELKPVDDICETQLHDDIERYVSLVAEVKSVWLEDSIPAVIHDSTLLGSRKPAKASYLEAFTQFCQSDALEFAVGKDSWELWSVASVKKACKKGTEPPEHKIWALFEQLSVLSLRLKQNVRAWLKQKGLVEIRQLLSEHKRQAQKISPDDLLSKLAAALGCADKGSVLAQKIARQFPVAMIDEFQDTDPQQYFIFSRIYASEDATMVMIGDPKQAIYGFRGADIFTYIDAKNAIADTHKYTLDTNWRSSAALVAAVNGLFEQSHDAFIYNDAIEFYPVQAASKADATPFGLEGKHSLPPLILWHLTGERDEPVTKGYAAQRLAIRCANEIVTMLRQAQNGQATIGDRALTAGDICVLVRDRNEADVMQKALTACGVSSVYLSRQSVFETPLAREFYLLLDAVHQPGNEKAIRAVLTTAFFGYSFNALWSLSQDEDQWQQMLDLFARLHEILLRSGAMALLQHLLLSHDLAGGWRARFDNSQRMLTDIRHICELLQHKSLELDGINRVLLWFHDQLVAAKDEGKVQQIRLEDDANLVQIVTMHASKGLEYNVVFLPFACGYRVAQRAIFHAQGDLLVDFADSEDNLIKADEERLAEDLRLLYVALTRAVHRLYIGVFNLKVGAAKRSHLRQTALGHLLFGDDESLNNATIAEKLIAIKDDLNRQGELCDYEAVPDSLEHELFDDKHAQTQDLVFRPFTGTIDQDWRVTSYSALTYSAGQMSELPGTTDEGEIIVAEKDALPLDVIDRFTFPKGADAGSCLHEILENIDFGRFAQAPSDEKAVEDAFSKYGIGSEYQTMTVRWIESILNTRLNRQGLKLNRLSAKDLLVEMEFYLPLARISPEDVNRLLSSHLKRPFDAFNFAEVVGVLKGYIDLVCCWQGQYFVVDYKSNHLGNSPDDYDKTQMARAMDEHHYHLQYLLYTLALHRFLRHRLHDYDYDRHIGGCYYLFLRGMDERNSHFEGIYFSKPSRQLIEQFDRLFEGQKSPVGEMPSPEQLGLFGGEQ